MNVFEIFAKLSLKTDDYESKLDKAKERANGIGSALATGAKVAGAAIGAAATAVGALTAQSVNAYSEYEQLEGGIQTLYGENTKAAQDMMQNASEAWKTAGMSANEYMETAIQSSAALINSLGGDTEEASKLMDMSIIDMSDNVNKMGTTMESVQNAYRGFSRGNFTMLDNLALGFAGTKEGMQELLDKAQQISGVKYDLSNYADIVNAIHVVQEEMGIAGTTQREATETIQGSISALKSAWTNLITGFSDPNADIGQLIENTVEAGVTALDNLIPAIERALVGIGEGVQKIVPIISEMLPDLVNDLLPPLLEAAAQLVDGLVSAIPTIIESLIDVAPKIIDTLISSILTMLPKLVDAGLKLIIAIAEGIGKNLKKIVPSVVKAILTIVQTIVTNLPKILDAALQIIKGLAQGILDALPVLIRELPKIINSITDFLIGAVPQIIQAGIQLLYGLIEAIPEIITALVDALPDIIDGILNALLDPENLMMMLEAGIELFFALVSSPFKIIEAIAKKIPEIITGTKDEFRDGIKNGKFDEVGEDIVGGISQGILKKLPDLYDLIGGTGHIAAKILRDNLDEHSPSRVMEKIGADAMKGLEIGIADNAKAVLANTEQVSYDMIDALDRDYTASYKMNNIASSRNTFVGAQDDYMDDLGGYEEEIIIPQNSSDSGRNLTVILELDRMQLGRAVYQLNNEETQRVGIQFAGGLV